MGQERFRISLEELDFAALEQEIDGLAGRMDRLAALGAASDEEAESFSNCVEDLWIRLISLKRGMLRQSIGEMEAATTREEVTGMLKMLRSDVALADRRLCLHR